MKPSCREICLSVEEGQIFGFLGPNGAGKSTLVKILVGLVYPTSGEVEVAGYAPLDIRGRRQVREILLALKAAGKTVFLNSHLLSEVEQICDRVAIINRGTVVAGGCRIYEVTSGPNSLEDIFIHLVKEGELACG